jgi:protein O-GlcNAc transferase
VAADPLAQAAALLGAGRAAEAEALLEPLCKSAPENTRAWFLLGAVRHMRRALDGALAAFDRAVALDPSNVQAAQAALAVLCEAGRAGEALPRCAPLLARHPDDAQVQFNVGAVHEAIGDPSRALAHYDRALALDPGFVSALQNRGIVLTRLGRVDEAVENNRRFVSMCPGSVAAHFNLAETFLAARRYEEAAAAARKALALDPGHALARLDLGLALAAGGHLQDARVELQRVVSRPDPAVSRRIEAWAIEAGIVDRDEAAVHLQAEDVFLVMGYERLMRCEWHDVDAFVGTCAEMLHTARPDSLRSRSLAFKLLHLPLPPSLQRTIAERVAEGVVRLASASSGPARRPRAHGERLRIGYMSADFGDHPVGHLTRSMYALHGRARFEVFAYALSGYDRSENFRIIAEGCDQMRDARPLSNERLADRIASDGIDILVDLSGYTRGGRPQVLALRPAPVRAAYVGYPATLGGRLADYLIVDGTAAPASTDALYAERIVRLPHSYLPASHRSYRLPWTPFRRRERLPRGGVVFCAFHRHEKIEPPAFGAWMRILRAVPGGVLWLQQGPGEENLRRHAQQAGVDPSRLVFAAHRPHAEHLARQRLADLFLDTRCWSAHTTAADALWSGVPVVTCPGEHLASRLAASLLHGLGLDELITGSLEEYEALAVDLASHPRKLKDLKQRLARNRKTHPLFDLGRLARNLERAYLEMWRLHESGEAPRSFDVEDPEPFAAARDFG